MSFDKTAIEEANRHLLAMNKRVIELGAMLNDKTVRLENIEKENQAKIEVIIRQKDAEIEKRSVWLESTQAEITQLKTEMTQKDNEITQLRLKAVILEKVSRYKPELIGLLNCLNELDNAAVSVPQSTITNPLRNTATNEEIVTNDQHNEDPTNGKLSVSSESEDAPQPDIIKHKTIVWTPKDRSAQQGDNLQNNGMSQKTNFLSKIPGGAMKHEHDAAQSIDSYHRDQPHNSDSDNLDSHVMNYETQL